MSVLPEEPPGIAQALPLARLSADGTVIGRNRAERDRPAATIAGACAARPAAEVATQGVAGGAGCPGYTDTRMVADAVDRIVAGGERM